MTKSVKNKIDLSVIILNYNSGDYLLKCLQSIATSKLSGYHVEVVVVDNASTDNSLSLLKSEFKKLKNSLEFENWNLKIVPISTNIGFAAGNNYGLQYLHPGSQLILFLNPDTIVEPDTLAKIIRFMKRHPQVDALTCDIIHALTGRHQPECHRGFPTPWRSFCHFTGLSRLAPKSKLLNGYFLGHLNLNQTHQIEACVGAFLLVRRKVGDDIGWWNEKYFFYGEDLDFCYKLHQKGYKLYFYPRCHITHYQGISSGIKANTQTLSSASRASRIRSALASTQAMRIFYQENLLSAYPSFLRPLVMSGIKLLEFHRLLKAKYL